MNLLTHNGYIIATILTEIIIIIILYFTIFVHEDSYRLHDHICANADHATSRCGGYEMTSYIERGNASTRQEAMRWPLKMLL